MTLEELITALDAADSTLVLPHGFTNPHSYRGYYDELAFEPATNVPVADMLADARSALGATYTGWKGGEFVMRGYTDCWLAQEGSAGGETLGPLLLEFMLAAGIRDAARTASGQQPNAVEETHVVTDDTDDPEHIDNCPGCWAFSLTGHVAAPAVGQPAEAQATDEAPLTSAERQFLKFALDLAFDRMVSDSGFTDEDDAALARLRRMAEEARS